MSRIGPAISASPAFPASLSDTPSRNDTAVTASHAVLRFLPFGFASG